MKMIRFLASFLLAAALGADAQPRATYVYTITGSLPGSYELWGDSLTTASLGYGGQLATNVSPRTVVNDGVGGQLSAHVAARAGAGTIQGTVAGNTIPTSGGVTFSSVVT